MSLLIIVTSESRLNELINEISNEYTLHKTGFQETRSKILTDPNKNHIITDALLLSQRYEFYCIARRFQLNFGVIIESDEAEPLGKYDIPVTNLINFKPKKSIANKKTSIANKKKIIKSDFQSKLREKVKKLNEKYGIDDDFDHIFMKIVNVADDIENVESLYEKIILQKK
ncbi:hypothetical protein DMUE_2760 [Dictyocoela muelleri]|nr:hypothetical protein DMUE_2760 [Dictyocoela muelleri]